MSDEYETIVPMPSRRRWHALGIVSVAAIVLVVLFWRPWKERSTPAERTAAPAMEGMNMSASPSVHLTAEQIRQFGVTFGSVEERRLEREIRAVGAVTVDETRVADVAPRFSGFAERLYVDFTGHPVRRGQPLAEVYSPEVLAAQQELIAARALERTIGASTIPGAPTESTNLLRAARHRLELWGISEGQIEDLLRTGQPTRTVTLHSPASGIVTAKHIVRGQAFEAGQTLYTITDLSQVWVDAALRESEAGAVRVGSGADLVFAAFPGRPFKGRVEYIQPTLDTMARTIRARVVVANQEGLLKPGMFATVRLTTPSRMAPTIPSSAVLRTGDRSIVFVDMGRGSILPVDVETGVTAGDLTEVLSGLEIGQRVVTSAQFLLDAESNLGEVMRAMIGQMGAPEAGQMDMPGMRMPEMPMPADTRPGARP